MPNHLVSPVLSGVSNPQKSPNGAPALNENHSSSQKEKAQLSLKTVRVAQERAALQLARPFLEMDANGVFEALQARCQERDTVSLLSEGWKIAEAAASVSRDQSLEADERSRFRTLAVDVADNFVRRYAHHGTFLEYDRASWLEAPEVWRTVPWGTAFRGQEMVTLFQDLEHDFSEQTRIWWRTNLEQMGDWICRNPIVGSFVFNCSIDLCHLLWRLGVALERPDWTDWALQAGQERIARDVDQNGWIHGENGGVSGLYQQVGAHFLARWAQDSGERFLHQVRQKQFETMWTFTTPSLLYPANFGTRSCGLIAFSPYLILCAAAEGNPRAVRLVRQHAQTSWSRDAWSRDLSLWQAALEAEAGEVAPLPMVRAFPAIESHVVKAGPFQAYFCDYQKSLWSRGFCNLWHEALDDFVFSTLHSLPSRVEKSKLHLGDTSDWAGFPHVRVQTETERFDSQQKIENFSIIEEPETVVSWDETLSSPDSKAGGTMRSRLRFAGEILHLEIELSDLAGPCQLDFHLLKRAAAFLGLWGETGVNDMIEGRLPHHGGWHHDRELEAEQRKLGVQIGNAVFAFEFEPLPDEVEVSLGHLQNQGLHSNNLGGARLRLETRSAVSSLRIALKFWCVSGKS